MTLVPRRTFKETASSMSRPPAAPRARVWSHDEEPALVCDVTTGICGPVAPAGEGTAPTEAPEDDHA